MLIKYAGFTATKGADEPMALLIPYFDAIIN
jgi:hypothetical protein